MNNIEVEVRSFITKEQYEKLLEFFNKEGKKLYEDEQETHYFDTKEDIRIQKNQFFSKIWMKKGKLHDDAREEIEIKVPKDDFDKLEDMFKFLGFNTEIKWFRKRYAFQWNDIVATVDYNKGYSYIFELEKMSSEEDKDETLELLKQKMKELGIPITPREEFEKKYEHYKENWRELTNEA